MRKENIVRELAIIFWIFIIGSICGYIFEMIVVLFQKGYFETRQGLIYGPFIPVYGMGAITYYLILNNTKIKSKWKIFLFTMIIGGITEYICSFIQEKLFGTISWDYSYLPFNINGRTSLLHCIYWGIAGILYVTYIAPMLEQIKAGIDKKTLKLVTIILSILLLFDISISYIASDRQTERRNNIGAKNKLDIFLDRYYPDEFMDKIYTNKLEVNK